MIRLTTGLAFACVFFSAATPIARGQWLHHPTPGIPRTADGKPNLTAPAPRTADGKPELSGLWQPDTAVYRFSVIQDLKDEAIFTPSAEALFMERVWDLRRDDPVTHCLPPGPSEILGGMYRLIESPTMVTLLFEGSGRYRQIFADGRKLPDDRNPTWLGYSVGRWDRDTFVVETAGFNDRSWLDRAGHPHSEQLRVTERFRRVDFGHIQFQITFEDPAVLKQPLNISLGLTFVPDTELLENVCSENERDIVRLVSKASARVQLSPAVLGKYAGRYQYREGSTVVAGFMGRVQTVTVLNGQLYLNALPLVPQSETTFDSSGASARFVVDADGRVQLVLSQAEGDARYIGEH
jgi:hypothetical protein